MSENVREPQRLDPKALDPASWAKAEVTGWDDAKTASSAKAYVRACAGITRDKGLERGESETPTEQQPPPVPKQRKGTIGSVASRPQPLADQTRPRNRTSEPSDRREGESQGRPHK